MMNEEWLAYELDMAEMSAEEEPPTDDEMARMYADYITQFFNS